ncbi:MAG: YceI family protein [Gammaproteobacteria bacterium]
MTGGFTGYARSTLRTASFLTALLLAGAALAAAPAPKFTLDPASSLLRFSFDQAGASNTGRFGKYTADVTFAADNLAASKIDVTIDITSLDTGDKERDDTLKSADLFNPAKFPKARFVSSKISAVGPGRYEAQGKLTIRDVTKDIKLPISFQTRDEKGKQTGYLTGRYTIKRLEYGVGQGEWKSLEWVKDDVLVTFSLKLTPVG